MSKTTKIKIEFASWVGKAALEIEASDTKEAVEKAVADGFGNWLVGCVTCDYRIQCVACTEDDAIRYWNTRPAEDALKKLIADIAATLAMCKDAIGEKAILDRYNEKLRERVGDLENDTDR